MKKKISVNVIVVFKFVFVELKEYFNLIVLMFLEVKLNFMMVLGIFLSCYVYFR